MNVYRRSLVCALVLSGLIGNSFASSERGSAAEAMTLVKKASSYLKSSGKDKAFAEFSNVKGQFVDRDLYIFVIDQSGKMLAHGANPKLIDKPVLELKDVENKQFIKEFISVANSKGEGWIDYKWVNPVTKQIEAKSTYVQKIDELIIGCGIYK